MEQLGELAIDTLLAPIDGDNRGGEDLTFSLLFDDIKEARRADPDYLPQGEWQTELKQADWAEVIQLSSQALSAQSKDLQLAGWLCEGLAHREGFEGIRFGLGMTARLLDEFWDDLYPSLDDEDALEERAARLGWMISTLAEVVRTLPLVSNEHYGLADYEESRQVENQARNDPDAMSRALAENKINDEIFLRAVVLTETSFLQQLHAEISAALTALSKLDRIGDERFGLDAPSVTVLQKVMGQCRDLVQKLLEERGAPISMVTAEEESSTDDAEEAALDGVSSATAMTASAVAEGSKAVLRTRPESREEAFDMLNGVARYFKEREPHSPVPYLIERAVKWGRMPLEDWLKDVIKDSSVIDNIRDTLGTQRDDDEY